MQVNINKQKNERNQYLEKKRLIQKQENQEKVEQKANIIFT
jgi:hypothetical protein